MSIGAGLRRAVAEGRRANQPLKELKVTAEQQRRFSREVTGSPDLPLLPGDTFLGLPLLFADGLEDATIPPGDSV